MKKNDIVKIIKIILLISILISSMPTFSNASMLDDVFKDGKDFISTNPDSQITGKIDDTKIINTSQTIYNILLTIGIIVAAVMILVVGIQFMTGSIEQKAKIKEMLIPFIVGCVVIFGSLTIWRLVTTTLSSVV